MKILLHCLLLGLALNSRGAGWPARLFAPYMYIGAGDHFQITQCDDTCGQKYFTLAFSTSSGSFSHPARPALHPPLANLKP